jgi:hypothetical protein
VTSSLFRLILIMLIPLTMLLGRVLIRVLLIVENMIGMLKLMIITSRPIRTFPTALRLCLLPSGP